MSIKTDVAKLFAAFAGQGNTLTIPRPYLTVCENDHRAALLLSQCVYWSDRTDSPDGWFVKSYADWLEELGMSEYEVRRAAKVLAPMGLETVVRKSRFHEGAPTLHYRVNMDKLSEFILKFLQYPEPLRNLSIEGVETEGSYTETISEITEKDSAAKNAALTIPDENVPRDTKPKHSKAPDPWYDNILATWGYHAGANGDMRKFLEGKATKKGWKEYNPPLGYTFTDAREICHFAAWYRLTHQNGKKELSMVAERGKLQSAMIEWVNAGRPNGDTSQYRTERLFT